MLFSRSVFTFWIRNIVILSVFICLCFTLCNQLKDLGSNLNLIFCIYKILIKNFCLRKSTYFFNLNRIIQFDFVQKACKYMEIKIFLLKLREFVFAASDFTSEAFLCPWSLQLENELSTLRVSFHLFFSINYSYIF